MAATFNGIVRLAFATVCLQATWAQITCPSTASDISTSLRETLLKTYNDLRKQLASGKAANKTGLLPAGKNIYKMAYDCELEAYALKLLDCANPAGGYATTSSSAITEAEMLSRFNATLTANWNLPVQYGVDSSLAHSENLINWQYMASDVLTRLGCAVKMCPAKDGVYSANYLCITGGGWNVYRKTYVTGLACKTDADCTLYPQSVCLVADGLCQTKASYPAADSNTICSKGSPRLNDAARLLMLDHHNFARSNMIKGKEAISAAGALSPAGSNMYKMEWDCEAERKAQAWLDQYPEGASAPDEYRTYGGKLHAAIQASYGGVVVFPPKESLELAFRFFWKRLLEYGWKGASNRTFTSSDDWAWAQLVWAKTYSMGCGISSSGRLVLCHYGPRGVYAGQLVYPAGSPCTSDSQCTTGVGDKCSVSEGLCLRGASPAAHLTCPKLGGHASTTVRTTMLDFHNNLRRELANGQTKNKTGLLPTGKNIYKLDYDCELEKATLASFDCSAASGFYWNTREMTEAELLTRWKANVQKRWDDVTVYGVDKDITPHANITNTWQWLATNRITKIGCAMLRCPVLEDGKYKVFITCTPGAGFESALPAYTPGPVCQKDSDCTLMPKSLCLVDEGLCRSEAVYPAPGVSTMCPSASNRLDDASRLRLLDMHNHRRSQLIHGREEMGNTYTFAPTGSNVYKLVWDCAAEAKSQAWIEDAVARIPHSSAEYRNYSGYQYGESLYMGPKNRPVRDAVEWAINWWWGELAEVGWYGAGNHTLTLADLENTDAHQTIGHWSNAAWAKTFRLGCGISKAGYNVCCQYGPGGNIVSPGKNEVYPPGKPCVKDADCTRAPLDKCSVADGLCLHA